MPMFDLPKSTTVQRVIPKNSFEKQASSKQKKLLTELIQRITWKHKIAPSTVNIPSENILEIQVFHIELKKQAEAKEILELIDKCIPYPILFGVTFEEVTSFHLSIKHKNASDENISIVDFTFSSHVNPPQIELSRSLDHVYFSLCKQLSNFRKTKISEIEVLVQKQKSLNKLDREIAEKKSKIKNARQFKDKVEANQKLKRLERERNTMLSV